jgi:dUTP pyrophosphatase
MFFMSVQIEIINQSHHPLPEYQTSGSAGMDLRANLTASVTLQPMERKLIPTGLFIALPEGYEAQIRPRSGLSIKRGLSLVNAIGTIDSDYRGELMVPIINFSAEAQSIEDGERIAQMVIARYEQASLSQVSVLSETERGAGGFGSSGTK